MIDVFFSVAAIVIDDTVIVSWVGPTGRTLDAMVIGLNGTFRSGIVSFANANTGLYVPSFALISQDRVGAVWTGDSGLEVRYRALPVDLAGVAPNEGTIVDADRKDSQQYARIAADPRGDGALVVWGTEQSGPLVGRFVSADEQPVLEPTSADFLVGCGGAMIGSPSLATGPSGTLASWTGSGLVIRRVTAP